MGNGSIWKTDFGQGDYSHSYGYNAIGNLTSVDGANWSYGAGSAGPHALTAAPGASFSYGDTGRQSSRTIDTVTTTLGWTPTGMTDTLTTDLTPPPTPGYSRNSHRHG